MFLIIRGSTFGLVDVDCVVWEVALVLAGVPASTLGGIGMGVRGVVVHDSMNLCRSSKSAGVTCWIVSHTCCAVCMRTMGNCVKSTTCVGGTVQVVIFIVLSRTVEVCRI